MARECIRWGGARRFLVPWSGTRRSGMPRSSEVRSDGGLSRVESDLQRVKQWPGNVFGGGGHADFLCRGLVLGVQECPALLRSDLTAGLAALKAICSVLNNGPEMYSVVGDTPISCAVFWYSAFRNAPIC